MKTTTDANLRNIGMQKQHGLEWAYITLKQGSEGLPFVLAISDADARALGMHIGKDVTITIETKE